MIFSPWPSARRIYLITEAGSWHLLGDVFLWIAPSNTPVVIATLQLQGSSGRTMKKDFFHLNFMKMTGSKVKSSIVLKIYWRKDKIIFDILTSMEGIWKNHTNWSILLQRFNYSADVSNTWRTGRWIRARWSCAGVPPHQRIKSCCGLMKILKIVGPS